MSGSRTKESQFEYLLELQAESGLEGFGVMSSQTWREDPRRLVFSLSRYKFVSKMLQGKSSALEVGCADGFGTRIVRQVVPNVTAVDFDPVFIEDAKNRKSDVWPIEFMVHDALDGPVAGEFDAAYSLDVIEHIPVEKEDQFVGNIVRSIKPDGVAIIGSPSLQSQAYASPQSKAGHINCKSGDELTALLSKYFANVFLFSMNDEVVHTGFHPMAHYFLAVCCPPRADIGR